MIRWNQKVGMRKPVPSMAYDIIRFAESAGYVLTDWQKALLERRVVLASRRPGKNTLTFLVDEWRRK